MFNRLAITFIIPLLALFLYVALVLLPMQLYTESECLRKGFPHAAVSFRLERYCIGTEGATTPLVVRQ